MARYDWNARGGPGAAVVNRVMRWVLPCLAAILWAEFATLIAGDWTLVFPPLLVTVMAALHRFGTRLVYGVQPGARQGEYGGRA